MFDLMTTSSLAGETFLGRKPEAKFIFLRSAITLKIFHLIYFDSKVKNHLKSHWENSVIASMAYF